MTERNLNEEMPERFPRQSVIAVFCRYATSLSLSKDHPWNQ